MSEPKGSGKAADQSRVARWFTDGLYIVVGASLAIMIIQIAAEVFGGSFMIDPISVPEELAKKGISAETVSFRIRDEMAKLESESRMGGEENTVKAIVEGNSAPEINVLGTSISIRYIADALRDMLHYQKFSGDLSFADQRQSAEASDAAEANLAISSPGQPPKVRLVLRVSHDSRWLFETEGTFDEVVRDGALAALQVADPYPAAIYLSRRQAKHAEALALIDRTLTATSRISLQSEDAAVLPDETLSRGELARAYVLMDMGKQRYHEARKTFEQADSDYASAQVSYRKGTHWVAALDGLTVLNIYEQNYDEALKEADLTKKANPDYESAFYHSAQAEDESFRAFVSGQVEMGVCEALEKARGAEEQYDDLIGNDSNFSAAYSQEAIMLAKKLAYLRASNTPTCESEPVTLHELIDKINDRFEMGLARDPHFFNGWYEWGLFLFQQIPQRDLQSPDGSAESVADAAIDRYDHAIRLVKADSYLSEVNAYLWLRKAQALVRRSELSSKPDSLRLQAKSALATYRQLVANAPKGQGRPGDETQIEAELQSILGVNLAVQNGER
jgi:tetratricopeptide (TPR) repeat protein